VNPTSLSRKSKGDLAELEVARDLIARGYKVAFPYGEDWDFDLIVCRAGALERVQVKYVRSDGACLTVKGRSHSLTNGKVRVTKYYTSDSIDWLAVFDATTGRCYYVPATELGSGRSELRLRLAPARNGQLAKIRPATEYLTI
jgi:hypothetical protein